MIKLNFQGKSYFEGTELRSTEKLLTWRCDQILLLPFPKINLVNRCSSSSFKCWSKDTISLWDHHRDKHQDIIIFHLEFDDIHLYMLCSVRFLLHCILSKFDLSLSHRLFNKWGCYSSFQKLRYRASWRSKWVHRESCQCSNFQPWHTSSHCT